MKKIISIFFLPVLMVLGSITAFAEIREGSIEISPFAGLHIYDTATKFENRGVYGLRLGYNITDKVGIEGAFNYASPRSKMLHADLLYHFTPDRSLNPFFVAGVGGARIKPRGSDSYDTLMANFGVGFKYFFTDNIAFRADVRDVITNMQNVVATAGLTFVFGGKMPKPAAEPAPPPPPPPPPAPVQKPAPAPVQPVQPPVEAREPVRVVLEDIHFEFDKATLTSAARDILDSNIRKLKENAGVAVQIEGHACAHGSEAYNMALSERRAASVKEYLITSGIAAGRLTTISYGESRLAMPEIPTPDNKESVEARANRRVHFEIIVK